MRTTHSTSSPSNKASTPRSSTEPGHQPHPGAILQRTRALPRSALTPTDVLALQRSYGNQVVQRLVGGASASPTQIQRKYGDEESERKGTREQWLAWAEKSHALTPTGIIAALEDTQDGVLDVLGASWGFIGQLKEIAQKNSARVDAILRVASGTSPDPMAGEEALTYYNSGTPLFVDASNALNPSPDPKTSDVEQGGLGDCYLLSALTAIVNTSPQSIKEMLVDEGDTVAVRFYRRVGYGPVRIVPEWVRVTKQIPGYDVTPPPPSGIGSFFSGLLSKKAPPKPVYEPRYTKPKVALWPAMIEKAFAAWKGKGDYKAIEDGKVGEALFSLLGRTGGDKKTIFTSSGVDALIDNDQTASFSPLVMNKAQLMSKINLSDDEATRFVNARRLKFNETPFGLKGADKAFIESETSVLAQELFGEAPTTLKKVSQYLITELQSDALSGKHFEGKLGSGVYSGRAMALYNKIKTAFEQGKFVGLGSEDWSPTNRDAAEHGGIYGKHAYAVTGVYPARDVDGKNLYFLKIRNPHGKVGRKYDAKFTKGERNDIDGSDGPGEFDIELSDVVRYFSTVDVG